MKRKIFILAAIVTLTAVCAVILAGCADVKGVEEFSLTPASEQTRESVLSSDVAYEYLEWMGGEEMISRYGSVDSGEINVNYGIGRAAMALAAEMDEMGYLPQEDIAVYVGENGAVTSLSANSQKVTGIMRVNTSIQGQESLNVVYVKPAKTEEGQSSAGQVVITAHFDNLFDMPSADGQVITASCCKIRICLLTWCSPFWALPSSPPITAFIIAGTARARSKTFCRPCSARNIICC